MPFKSEQQRRFLFSQKPEVAEKFVKHSDSDKKAARKRAIVKRMRKKNGNN